MSRAMAAAAALALCLPAEASPQKAKSAKKEAPMEWSGQSCPVELPSHRVVHQAGDWLKLWKELGRTAPQADLTRNFAVAVFLGERPTGGYGVSWEKPVETGKELIVRYRERGPGNKMVMQMITQPYAVKLFPATGKAVKVEAIPD